MNRSKLRENIFKLLYTAEFQEKEEMPQQMSLYFTYSDDNDEDEEVTVSEKDQTYMEEKYHHVTEHIPEIDEMLNRTSEARYHYRGQFQGLVAQPPVPHDDRGTASGAL